MPESEAPLPARPSAAAGAGAPAPAHGRPTPASGRRASFLQLAFADLFRPAAAAALLGGAVAVQVSSALPSRGTDLAIAVLGLVLACRPGWLRLFGLALLGAAWTLLRADLALAQRLPAAYEGRDLVVTGSVAGLPRASDEGSQFEFIVDTARLDGAPAGFGGRIRVSWYDDAPTIEPCSTWRLRVRLRRPRGMIDPGAFDFERYALSEGIAATGYVRAGAEGVRTGERAWCVDRLRARIGANIAATIGPGPRADVLRALAFGDQHAMDEREWEVARATGIPHLIAISGLHIALFAGFGVALLRLFWKCAPRVTLRWPAPLIEAVASIAFASAYALVAGLGLPTRRALVMIGVLLAANLLRRARAPAQGLAFAVIALLALDPLCVLSAGFWLSFVGVAWLMFCLGRRDGQQRWWRELVTAQGVATIGLLPLTVWFFGQSSLVGPVANLVAVPWICFVVLPLGVSGALLQLVLPLAGDLLVRTAGTALDALWWLLERMAGWPGGLWYFPEPTPAALGAALLGATWLLLPRGMPGRPLGAALFVPLLVPLRAELHAGEFEAWMLDVGQGLAVVVRTRDHALVYDAGARFPSGFDLGEASVVPALHALGIRELDRLVVSHGDNDHAGGAAAVLAAFPGAAVSAGEPGRLAVPAAQCRGGESWTWNGVRFRFVHPRAPLAARANDRCCVLDVRGDGGALLLSGDISSAVEGEVAEAIAPAAAHTVLQVPHHGSKTSSSAAFVAAVAPDMALVSTGYRNRFHHPAPAVAARYAASGIELLDTAQAGFIDVTFAAGAAPRVVERGRLDRHAYWRE